MDSAIFEILEFLASKGIGTSEDIAPILNDIRKKGVHLQQPGDVSRFMESLTELTNFNQYITVQDQPPHGFINLKLAITNNGVNALKAERDRRRQRAVDESSIGVNKSIIATNEAVQNMDNRMLEHTATQVEILKQQSNFSEQQVKLTEQQVNLVAKQNKLYRATIILTGMSVLGSLFVLKVTIDSNADKELISIQRSQLEDQRKEIKQLQLLKSDTIHSVLRYPVSKNKKK
jgi:hypothetical protein